MKIGAWGSVVLIALGAASGATAGPAGWAPASIPVDAATIEGLEAPRLLPVRRLVQSAPASTPSAPSSASMDKAADAWGECIAMASIGNAASSSSAETIVDAAFRKCSAQELATYTALSRSVGGATASQVTSEFDKMKRETRTMMIGEVNKFRAEMQR